MSNNTSDRQGTRRAGDGGPSWWHIGLGVAAGVATVAGGIYVLSKLDESQEEQKQTRNVTHSAQSLAPTSPCEEYPNEVTTEKIYDSVSRLTVSAKPSVNNLNSLLDDIHVRYTVIKREDFAPRYEVLMNVFNKLHGTMKAVDSYYQRYSSGLIFRPEEFKMYILIRLPGNIFENCEDAEENDIDIEPQHSSFVQLCAGTQYTDTLLRDDADCLINRTAHQWLDDSHYILHSKFNSWFQSVLDRALSKLQSSVRIGDIDYKITTSFKEGAFTLWITNALGFRMDVNLIPSLQFPNEGWLGKSKAYREIPSSCIVDYWMVVPKPDKFGANSCDDERSWHLELQEQEKEFIHDSFHLRQAMRLLKKLRDAQRMTQIDNYHIETFFLWKCETAEKSFWDRDVADVFKVILQEFCQALDERKILYFWNESHNLLEKIPEDILKGYARKLGVLDTALESDYMMAAVYFLTDAEYTEYKRMLTNAA